MPVEVDVPESCIAVHFARMTAVAAAQIERTQERELTRQHERERSKGHATDFYGPTDLEVDPFVAGHRRNVATTVVWILLYLLSPEVVFRLDAVAALYALCDYVGEGGYTSSMGGGGSATQRSARNGGSSVFSHLLPGAPPKPSARGGVLSSAAADGPTQEESSSLFGAEIFGLYLFWPALQEDDDDDSMSMKQHAFESLAEDELHAVAAAVQARPPLLTLP